MDMIRWLATNKVVLTAWGLGLLAILLASLFGGSKKPEAETAAVETTAVVEQVADAAKPATAAVAATAAAATTAVQAAVNTGAEKAEEVVTEAVETVAAATATDDASTDTATAETTEAADSGDASATAESTDAKASTAAADDLSGKSSDDILMMAREAYWDNGLDKAASLYSELITREPTVIEHKGELGNVFWRQGYPKKAAELYADIAEPMIEQGNGERVSNMVGFIGLFFPERAANIRKLLDAQ